MKKDRLIELEKEIIDLKIKLIKLEELNKQQFDIIIHLENQIIEYEKMNKVYRRVPQA